MKTKNLTIKALAIATLALLACDPEYPTPAPTNKYNSATGNANIMFTNATVNGTTLSLAIDNTELAATETGFGVKYPATTGYASAVPSGSRNIRLLAADGATSLASVRSLMNANATSSYFAIGRADVAPTVTARADRPRLIEFLAESLPAVPVTSPNTAYVRLLNFGLTTPPVAPATSGGTLGSIALRLDASSPTPAPTIPVLTTAPTGTYILPSDQVFPIPAPAAGATDLRSLPKSYASTTSPFTAFTIPAVGTGGNNYVVDVVTSSNGNVVIEDVALNLAAGRVYTLVLIGSSVPEESAPYQLLVIRNR